jgi:hypothetical protein
MKGSNQTVHFGTLFSVLKPSFLEGLRPGNGRRVAGIYLLYVSVGLSIQRGTGVGNPSADGQQTGSTNRPTQCQPCS